MAGLNLEGTIGDRASVRATRTSGCWEGPSRNLSDSDQGEVPFGREYTVGVRRYVAIENQVAVKSNDLKIAPITPEVQSS